ncbi:hypothetical protein Ancab_020957 [Ancistrocladus abbreviatus]
MTVGTRLPSILSKGNCSSIITIRNANLEIASSMNDSCVMKLYELQIVLLIFWQVVNCFILADCRVSTVARKVLAFCSKERCRVQLAACVTDLPAIYVRKKML